ncbi:lysine N(6)-hydroxylase/L-ornithine N(5)-oxygenase family protein [Fodinicola acaciae]|uniref:lysine N(6)-hydroxylase/L-ornithine N(5)-oxygenase family protein n=1 Tax=Fodinicola acaciae TaxID=2681555 RepID=UPI001C9E8507|nr:lysine N(6)-hydroxylase/L-ornithine N(5)-oxygenase family protein [Fodinicola acaciae]
MASEPYDIVGVGIGPFNLALAALADPVPDLRCLFLDAKPEFSWHPGMLLAGTTLQVPFLADLVTLADPTSRWSFLNYLRQHDRLFPFYFSERFHVPRREYDHYCRWVSTELDSCEFGARVVAVRRTGDLFEVTYEKSGAEHTVLARNLVLGVGTEPVLPEPLTKLDSDRVVHSSGYLGRRAAIGQLADVTVVGAGQSGAEIFLDLLREAQEHGRRVRWITQTPFAPMEYSKLGLEHFTPAYTEFFRRLPPDVRDATVPAQWQLYKAISEQTIAEIFDVLYEQSVGGQWPAAVLLPEVSVIAAAEDANGLELSCRHETQDSEFSVRTDAIVAATGYAARQPELLAPIFGEIAWDDRGRYQIDADYRVSFVDESAAGLYVQNAELHTHGVGAPDLGLGAHRAAVILNAVTGRTTYRLPARTSFTTFGAPAPDPESEEPRVAVRAR